MPDGFDEKVLMGKVEFDKIREMLQGALQNLGEEAGVDLDSAPIAVVSGGNGLTDPSGSPIIVVVASDPKSLTSTKATPPLSTIASECDCDERKVSHPGLERFTIERSIQTSAPKTCFMEPDRPCVNSGACEMRGF